MSDAMEAAKLLTNGRDKREPRRKEKELAELKLQAAFNGLFKRQRKAIADRLRLLNFGRKSPNPAYDDIFETDPETIAAIARLLLVAARGGSEIFGEEINFDFDDSLTNAEASKWAQSYAFDLVKNIDATSKKALNSVIAQFVDTPGMTIQDVVDLLPYDPSRSLKIAVTEITRAYAEGQKIAGQQLKEQYPGVRITKTWFTNNDDRVCDLCGPLDMMEVDFDKNYKAKTPSGEDIDIDQPPQHVNCRCWQSTGTKV
jgi:hypothetical protein